MKYDAATNSFSNSANVDMMVPDFGGTGAFEYLRTGTLPLGAYLHDMVEYFVDRGYKRGVSIRGAPYDWRLAAGEKCICTHLSFIHLSRNVMLLLCYSYI